VNQLLLFHALLYRINDRKSNLTKERGDMVNEIRITGIVMDNPKYSHSIGDCVFYSFPLATRRLSGNIDRVLVHIHEEIKDQFYFGQKISIAGEMRTYRGRGKDDRLHLYLYIMPYAIDVNSELLGEDEDIGSIEGEIRWIMPLRKTPRGRTIVDFCLKSERLSGKYDTIPCIAWEENANDISLLKPGDKLKVKGRLQSRDYVKRFENGDEEVRTAYEFSVFKVEGREK